MLEEVEAECDAIYIEAGVIHDTKPGRESKTSMYGIGESHVDVFLASENTAFAPIDFESHGRGQRSHFVLFYHVNGSMTTRRAPVAVYHVHFRGIAQIITKQQTNAKYLW